MKSLEAEDRSPTNFQPTGHDILAAFSRLIDDRRIADALHASRDPDTNAIDLDKLATDKPEIFAMGIIAARTPPDLKHQIPGYHPTPPSRPFPNRKARASFSTRRR